MNGISKHPRLRYIHHAINERRAYYAKVKNIKRFKRFDRGKTYEPDPGIRSSSITWVTISAVL